ncbi:Uncharacterized protein PBTT_04399 [Plasmodiophora brassicae]
MLGVVADEHRRLFVEERDFMAQTDYLASMITIRKAPAGSVPGSYQYALPGSDGIPIVICRQAFMKVFGMGTVKRTNVIKRMTNQYGVPQGAVPSFGMDSRGKSNVAVRNRTPHNVLEIARASIVSQLKQFGETSHYLQEEQAQVIYMPADQSPSSLWRQLVKLLLRDDAKWMNFGRHRQWSHPGEMWVRSCLQASATWKKYRICLSAPADMPDLIVT